MKKRKMDKLLKEWGEWRTGRQEDTSELVNRITAKVREEPTPVPPEENAHIKHMPRAYVVRFAAAVAAMLVAIAGGIFAWTLTQKASSTDPVAQITIRENEAHEKQKLLREMSNVFQSDLRWISESGENVQVNVADQSPRTGTQGPPVLLKVLLLRKSDNAERGEVIWKGDVVGGSEQIITVNPTPDTPENELTFWLYPLNHTGVVVDFEMSLKNPVKLQSSCANQVVTRRPRRVLSVGDDNGTYNMYLSATRLNGKQGLTGDSQCKRTKL